MDKNHLFEPNFILFAFLFWLEIFIIIQNENGRTPNFHVGDLLLTLSNFLFVTSPNSRYSEIEYFLDVPTLLQWPTEKNSPSENYYETKEKDRKNRDDFGRKLIANYHGFLDSEQAFLPLVENPNSSSPSPSPLSIIMI